MTDAVILDDIPFQLDLDPLVKRLRIREGSSRVKELGRIASEAETIARPKALFKISYIESKGDDHVVVEGVRLTSRVLRVNLEQAHRVFAFVATCGTEVADWARSMDDMLWSFWADSISEVALRVAIQTLNQHLAEQYRPGRTSVMNPGSLADWPLQAQRSLFAILGDPEEAIGVRLSDGLLMIPTKSISGIRFPTEESFESCQLCSREGCPGRRALYDEGLYDRRYAKRASSQ
jgi:hypothetical protein